MSTPFQDACTAASAAVDAVYSEDWLYQPMATAGDDVNARNSPNPDRAALTIAGVYVDPFARAHSGPSRHQGTQPERPGHASARPSLNLDLSALPYAPRGGDRVTRCATGKHYHVAQVRPDSANIRADLDLNEL